jgi:outer membrane protein assembly factor BamB
MSLLLAMTFSCLTLVPTCNAKTSTDPDPIEGKWYGVAGFPVDRVELGFEFKRNAKNELKAYLYHPIMNFYGLEIPGLVVRDGNKYSNRDYILNVTLENGKLEGTYFSLRAPISLTRTNKFPAEVPIPKFPVGPGPKWSTKLSAPIYANVAVRDDLAYVGTLSGCFHGIKMKDGAFAWSFCPGRPIHGEALVDATHVYFVCDNGYLYKLDRLTGKEIWRYDLGDERVPRILPHQVIENSGNFDFDMRSPCPLLVEGVLYVGSGDGSMHAVNAADGKRVWRFEGKGKIRTDAISDGPRVIFGTWENMVYALDRLTGKEVWNKNTFGPITDSPSFVSGKLLVGNRNGLLAALNPATGERIWRMAFWGSAVESTAVEGEGGLFYIGASDLRRISLIDSKDGRVVWRTDIFGWAWPRPALTEKIVYASAAGAEPYQMRHVGSLNALDRVTGKIIWRWPTPPCSGCWITGFAAAPTISGNTLLVGGLDGTLYAFPV